MRSRLRDRGTSTRRLPRRRPTVPGRRLRYESARDALRPGVAVAVCRDAECAASRPASSVCRLQRPSAVYNVRHPSVACPLPSICRPPPAVRHRPLPPASLHFCSRPPLATVHPTCGQHLYPPSHPSSNASRRQRRPLPAVRRRRTSPAPRRRPFALSRPCRNDLHKSVCRLPPAPTAWEMSDVDGRTAGETGVRRRTGGTAERHQTDGETRENTGRHEQTRTDGKADIQANRQGQTWTD